jgi:hypothetical protein
MADKVSTLTNNQAVLETIRVLGRVKDTDPEEMRQKGSAIPDRLSISFQA